MMIGRQRFASRVRIEPLAAAILYGSPLLRGNTMITELITLEPATGKLFWKPRQPHHFSAKGQRSPQGCCNNWNSRYANKECLTAIGTHGYRWGNFMGKALLAHRAAFFLANGYMPGYVDHINGDKLDNRPTNLREATNGQNIANSKSREGSSSKYLGVSWNKVNRNWTAYITSNWKGRHIGSYATEEQAALAYNKAAIETHGEYARLNVIHG